MYAQDLLRDCVFTRVSGATAAGTTAVNTSIVDMQDYDGIVFLASLSGVLTTSVVTLAIQGNTLNSTSGMATLTGSTATWTNSGGTTLTGLMGVQAYRPLLRYQRAVLTPATANAAIDAILAVQFRGRAEPANLLTNFAAYAVVAGV